MLLTNREHEWSPAFNPIGWSLTLGGITLFAIFGVIAGGLFIQVMAPILLVAAGTLAALAAPRNHFASGCTSEIGGNGTTQGAGLPRRGQAHWWNR